MGLNLEETENNIVTKDEKQIIKKRKKVKPCIFFRLPRSGSVYISGCSSA